MNRKRTNFYTQGQQCAASTLLTVSLLASCNLNTVLAAPEPEEVIESATTTSPPGQPDLSVLTLPADRGLDMDTTVGPAATLLPRTTDQLASRFVQPRPSQDQPPPAWIYRRRN